MLSAHTEQIFSKQSQIDRFFRSGVTKAISGALGVGTLLGSQEIYKRYSKIKAEIDSRASLDQINKLQAQIGNQTASGSVSVETARNKEADPYVHELKTYSTEQLEVLKKRHLIALIISAVLGSSMTGYGASYAFAKSNGKLDSEAELAQLKAKEAKLKDQMVKTQEAFANIKEATAVLGDKENKDYRAAGEIIGKYTAVQPQRSVRDTGVTSHTQAGDLGASQEQFITSVYNLAKREVSDKKIEPLSDDLNAKIAEIEGQAEVKEVLDSLISRIPITETPAHHTGGQANPSPTPSRSLTPELDAAADTQATPPQSTHPARPHSAPLDIVKSPGALHGVFTKLSPPTAPPPEQFGTQESTGGEINPILGSRMVVLNSLMRNPQSQQSKPR